MYRLIGTTTGYNFLSIRNFTTSYGYYAASNRTSFVDPEGDTTSYVLRLRVASHHCPSGVFSSTRLSPS